jgi:hypothetical protein
MSGRRFAPQQLRHVHVAEMVREGVPLVVIRRQLGHSKLGITSVYLQGSTTPRSSNVDPRAPLIRRERCERSADDCL